MLVLLISVFATMSVISSFIPRVIAKTGLTYLIELFTCPVCLGYHIGYISFLIGGYGLKSFGYAFATSFLSLLIYKIVSILDSLELMIDKKTGGRNGM